MHSKTGVDWLDEIVDRANLPLRLDRGAAAITLGRLLGDVVSVNTLRRWPIPYKLIGRSARYQADDLIAFAHKRIAETPLREPPPLARRRSRRAHSETLPTP